MFKDFGIKIFLSAIVFVVLGLLLVKTTFAQTYGITSQIGSIGSVYNFFAFAFNFLVYLGWGGVIIGIGFVLFAAVYKITSDPSEQALTNFRNYVIRAVAIAAVGLLLLSSGFIVNVVAELLNSDVTIDIPEELKD